MNILSKDYFRMMGSFSRKDDEVRKSLTEKIVSVQFMGLLSEGFLRQALSPLTPKPKEVVTAEKYIAAAEGKLLTNQQQEELDKAREIVREWEKSREHTLPCAEIEPGMNLATSPGFIEFRNQPEVNKLFDTEFVSKKISDRVKDLNSDVTIDLDDAILVAESIQAFTMGADGEMQPDVHSPEELFGLSFGKDTAKIMPAGDSFDVELNPEGKKKMNSELGKMREYAARSEDMLKYDISLNRISNVQDRLNKLAAMSILIK